MAANERVHERAVLDALEALDPEPFSGPVWRITRKGRDPLRGSSVHGRWSPTGEFEVLYTSMERAGALAEIGYRLSLEPVSPSRVEHELHQIEASTERSLRFADVAALEPLGIDVRRRGSFDYQATQAIAAAANFLGFDGLIVPSARSATLNLVIFLEQIALDHDVFGWNPSKDMDVIDSNKIEHDVVRKPVPTFRHHALGSLDIKATEEVDWQAWRAQR